MPRRMKYGTSGSSFMTGAMGSMPNSANVFPISRDGVLDQGLICGSCMVLSQFDPCEFDELDSGRMYGAKEHLLFDGMRQPHGAGDDAHLELRVLLNGVDEQVGVDVFPAIDPEMVAELITGPGRIVVGAELRINGN